ncbi:MULTISPECIES: helix-turn-helix transcriptional regulator [Enterococcus]|uniref:HTH deoR-type domain-containing protein n=1 Tax=Candidatus Enterococcus ferrettii TaxID=2815324 RepID=A0ABV0EK97_9ENTE|nr:YafY family protein [Enterococcus sp. 665A]MBO1341638.1 YafY family transcriptional regulator [Enterococcus sp. 665A]
MKIDRLIGIITILLQKEKVTTAQLAERFEVSCRTIQRDIDNICKAGIPIVSMQGYGGGISIAEGYKINKTILTEKELSAIFMGLKSIDSISKDTYSQNLMEKLTNERSTILSDQNRVLIHLSSFHQESLTEKIDVIKQAISNRELISFQYYSEKGESQRVIEPYYIMFRWLAWYVYGYCLAKQDYRLFKLNRLSELQNAQTNYEERFISEKQLNFDDYIWIDDIKLIALFDTSVKYRLIDEYGPECITFDKQSGKLRFENVFTNRNHLTQWILSYGDAVRVIEPLELIDEVCKNAKNILVHYE